MFLSSSYRCLLHSDWLKNRIPEMLADIGMTELREVETVRGEPIHVDSTIVLEKSFFDSFLRQRAQIQ